MTSRKLAEIEHAFAAKTRRHRQRMSAYSKLAQAGNRCLLRLAANLGTPPALSLLRPPHAGLKVEDDDRGRLRLGHFLKGLFDLLRCGRAQNTSSKSSGVRTLLIFLLNSPSCFEA